MHVAMAAAVRLACMSPFIDVMPLSKWSETSHRVYVYDHEHNDSDNGGDNYGDNDCDNDYDNDCDNAMTVTATMRWQ